MKLEQVFALPEVGGAGGFARWLQSDDCTHEALDELLSEALQGTDPLLTGLILEEYKCRNLYQR